MKYNIICVDFDATLSMLDEFPNCGNPSRGFGVLKKYRENGGKLILWTCRSDDHLQVALDFCKEQGLEFDAVNTNLEGQSKKWKDLHPGIVMSRKIYADMYIDDKDPVAIIRGIDWDLIDLMINEKDALIFPDENTEVYGMANAYANMNNLDITDVLIKFKMGYSKIIS